MKLLLSIFAFFTSLHCHSQISWEKCYGGTTNDGATCIRQTFDGGYVVAGDGSSLDGDETGNHGGEDFWVLKISASGGIEWQKSYGGSLDDAVWSVVQTPDSGYVLVGLTSSNDGDVSGNHNPGSYDDFWIVRLAADGTLLWQKCLGGVGSDEAYSVVQTSDGGYVVAGRSSSTDGDVTGNHGNDDYWLVKLSSSGALQWQRSYGGSQYDYLTSMQQSMDGGYILAGFSLSNDGDVTGNHGIADYWVVKVSSTGVLQWQKSLGGTLGDQALAIASTTDSGSIVVGYSYSNDGDVSGHHGSSLYRDCWVVKLSSAGALQWQRSLGGSDNDAGWSVIQLPDTTYLIAGGTYSTDGDVSGNHGGDDLWVVNLSASGNILSQKCYGGSSQDEARSITYASGGVIVAGSSSSYDGEVTGGHGLDDYWVVKLAPKAGITNVPANPAPICPNPTTGIINIPGDYNAVEIYNSLGQLIRKAGRNDNISIASYPAGLYLVKAMSADGTIIAQEKITKL